MTEREELTLIEWAILESKLAYYEPEAIHPSWKSDITTSDFTYDALESRAKVLAASLGIEFVSHVGVPSTASMRMVRQKLSHRKDKDQFSCLSRL